MQNNVNCKRKAGQKGSWPAPQRKIFPCRPISPSRPLISTANTCKQISQSRRFRKEENGISQHKRVPNYTNLGKRNFLHLCTPYYNKFNLHFLYNIMHPHVSLLRTFYLTVQLELKWCTKEKDVSKLRSPCYFSHKRYQDLIYFKNKNFLQS